MRALCAAPGTARPSARRRSREGGNPLARMTAVVLAAVGVGLAGHANAQSSAVLPLGSAATLAHEFPSAAAPSPTPTPSPTVIASPGPQGPGRGNPPETAPGAVLPLPPTGGPSSKLPLPPGEGRGEGATLPSDLAVTIQHYLLQSAQRDGLRGAKVAVQLADGAVSATLRSSSPIPTDYQARVARFLAIGDEGYQASLTLQQGGAWNAKWRFLLPLGLPIVNQRSVQLMHFPPDYAVKLGDYLGSRTSKRWEALLRANGVKKHDLPLYEDIVDIAPIAAPASTGADLTKAVPAFKTYTRDMLAFALSPELPLPPAGEGRGEGGNPPALASASAPAPTVIASPGAQAPGRGNPGAPTTAQPIPLVAYGAPVRSWLESEFGIELSVLALATITIGEGQPISVLGANHPSFIWYAAQQPNARPLALKITKQDLIAACWQATMTLGTEPDSTGTLAWCTAKWNARPRQICILSEIEAFNSTAARAKAACSAGTMAALATAGEVSDEELARIERAAPLNEVGR